MKPAPKIVLGIAVLSIVGGFLYWQSVFVDFFLKFIEPEIIFSVLLVGIFLIWIGISEIKENKLVGEQKKVKEEPAEENKMGVQDENPK